MLRQILLTASRSDNLKKLSVSAPVARDVVGRFVAGEATGDAVRTVAGLADTGLLATVDHLGRTRPTGIMRRRSGTPTWSCWRNWSGPDLLPQRKPR